MVTMDKIQAVSEAHASETTINIARPTRAGAVVAAKAAISTTTPAPIMNAAAPAICRGVR